MLKDFHTIHTSEKNMWFTDSHLFIVPFHDLPSCGMMPNNVFNARNVISLGTTPDQRKGKCWIISERLGDDNDWFIYRHMQPRTIWFALFSCDQEESDLRKSLSVLKQWVLKSELPLKIAIDYAVLHPENGKYCRTESVLVYGAKDPHEQLYRIFADELGDLDVIIYHPGVNAN